MLSVVFLLSGLLCYWLLFLVFSSNALSFPSLSVAIACFYCLLVVFLWEACLVLNRIMEITEAAKKNKPTILEIQLKQKGTKGQKRGCRKDWATVYWTRGVHMQLIVFLHVTILIIKFFSDLLSFCHVGIGLLMVM